MKSLNKDFLPVHVAGDVYTKEEVYTKDEVDALIEGAGGASGLVVNVLVNEQEKMYLNKNYTEITTALNNGIMPVICVDESDEVVTNKLYPAILYCARSGNTPGGMLYQVVLRMYNSLDDQIEFSSSTADGVLTEE